MSESPFKRHVQPELRVVRRGSFRTIPVTIALDRYGHLMPGSEVEARRCWTTIWTGLRIDPWGRYGDRIDRL